MALIVKETSQSGEKHRAEGFEKPYQAVRSIALASPPIAPHSAQYNELACAEFRRLAPFHLRFARNWHVFLVGRTKSVVAPELLSNSWLELKMNFNSGYGQGQKQG
jgi:hypothetical protein